MRACVARAGGHNPGWNKMKTERLAAMANDIGAFFVSESEPEAAIAGIAHHLSQFWTSRMRRQLIEQLPKIRDDLDPLPAAALLRLALRARAGSPTP